jgi:hypothetical protein
LSTLGSRPVVAEIGVVLLLCAVALVLAGPVLSELHNWGILDWDQHLFHHAVARATLLEHFEFPLWNPYNWSGVPLLANPESRVLAPTFALTLLFGEVVGLKLEIVLSLVVGMLGAFHLLRHLGAGRLGALAAAFVAILNSWYAIHMTVGHTWALNVAYLPWAFLFYPKSIEDLRYSLAASLALVLMFFGGGIYLFVMTVLLFAFYSAACLVLRQGTVARHTAALAAIAGLTVLVSAVKLLPVVELMLEHPRTTSAETGYTIEALGNALFARSQTLASAYADRPGEFLGWMHEGLYVGLLALVLFLFGVVRGPRRRAPLLLVLLLFVWTTLGSQVPISLWSGLHELPVLDNMRLTQRFGIVAVLVFAVFVGFGVEAVQIRVAGWTSSAAAGTLAAAALVLAMLTDLVLVSAPVFREAFPIEPIPVRRDAEFRQILSLPEYDARGWRRRNSNPLYSTLSGVYPAFPSNRGSTRGYEVVPIPSRAAFPRGRGYRGEVYLEGTGGRVDFRSWSPNQLVLDVKAERAGTVVVNQNHAPGWRLLRYGADGVEPGEVLARDGLLAVAVDASDIRLELVYRPKSFVIGALVTSVSLAGLAGMVVWSRRRGPAS